MDYALKCGAAKTDITPAPGTILYGYAPGRPSESVGDPLEAVGILLTSAAGSAFLISCTICAMNPELSRELRRIAGDTAGVDPSLVTICCTHTHSGPNTSLRSGWGDVDEAYIEKVLKPGIRNLGAAAKEALTPAEMGIAETESDVGINRREITESGEIILGQNPWGPRDPRMTVISFRGHDGKPLANLIHYGCHGTASGQNPEITRDWSGVMTDMLEAETGAVTGFFNGFEGDQGPRLPNGRTTGTYQMALQLGARAGYDAIRAYKMIRQWKDAPVTVLQGEVRIPFGPLPSKEEAEEKLRELGTLEEICASRRYESVNAHIHWTQVAAEHASGAPLKTHFTFPQTITVIGPAAVIPCPFEAFSEIGLRLRKHSPYPYTLSLCNSHGCYAYLPTLSEIPRGGYEVWHFLLAMRTVYPLPKNSDDHWVSENLAILRGRKEP